MAHREATPEESKARFGKGLDNFVQRHFTPSLGNSAAQGEAAEASHPTSQIESEPEMLKKEMTARDEKPAPDPYRSDRETLNRYVAEKAARERPGLTVEKALEMLEDLGF